jgi:hypothetical protein
VSRAQLEVFLEHDAEGGFVAMVDRQPVGAVTTIGFGPSGWVGNLIVEPDFRSRGIGRALMERAINRLEGEGATTVRLEADPPGVPLYRSLGFVDELESRRFTLPPSAPRPSLDESATDAMGADDLDEMAELDTAIVGPNRRRFLELKRSAADLALLRRRDGRVVASLLASSTDRGLRIGPCVALEPADARRLLVEAVAFASGRPVLVGLPAPNAQGHDMLAEMGCERGASSQRMRRGPPVDAGDPTRVYAIASGAVG